MGKGVEIFGGLFVFTFCVLLIPQMLAFAVGYKTINELTSSLVEIIEVHDGLTEPARQEIETWKQRAPEVTVETERQLQDQRCTYQVTGKLQIEVALIGLKTELKASKTTKRVIY